jgi:hypothetical protein
MVGNGVGVWVMVGVGVTVRVGVRVAGDVAVRVAICVAVGVSDGVGVILTAPSSSARITLTELLSSLATQTFVPS